ncbi:MAG: TonB-dependent receptor [Polyangiaceae bacterium]|nr:TonB-dependent receptor [Polyangiaceae bacterium]
MSLRPRPHSAPRSLWASVLMIAAILFTAIPAFAQGSGVIAGKVSDAATSAPIGDVVVTATAPELQGEQIVVTDGSGSYRIPNLPPGSYTLRFEKETYRPFSRSGITLRSAVTLNVPIKLQPEALKAEEIVVVGKAPTVDVGSSAVAQNINQDFTRRIAVANPSAAKGGAERSFEAIAETAPGAKADNYGTSINGTTSPENQYVIDGLSVNDPAYGVVGTPLSVEFVKEVNVVSGGYMPEYGRSTGGVLDVVTKSGGNDFHGSVFFNITPGAFEGEREIVRRNGSTIMYDFSLSSIRDFGFEVGGPIIKDKLWFFAGMQFAFTTRNIERSLNRTIYDMDASNDTATPTPGNPGYGNPIQDENGFTVVERLPGTEKFYRAQAQSIQYIGKLTYQVNQDNSLTLSIYGSPSTTGGSGTYGIDPQDGGIEIGSSNLGSYSAYAHKYVASANDIALKWSSAFDNKRLLFDTTIGWHHQESARLPSDGSAVGSRDGLAGVPAVLWRRNDPYYHSIQDFEGLPAEALALCRNVPMDRDGDGQPDDADGDGEPDEYMVPCPTTTYFSGGPDFIDEASLDRFQIKGVVTTLFEGLGHHVVKGGLDAEIMTYDHKKAYSGRERFRESFTGTTHADNRMYAFITGPEVGDYVIQDAVEVSSLSTTIGGFAQDSWSILDKVTLNIGLRYDAQYLISDDGKLGMALPNQWSPRVGVVYDFTQEGRSKLYANFARYYESVPLDVVDRSFGDERQLTSSHYGTEHPAAQAGDVPGCDPRDPASDDPNHPCQSNENRRNIGFAYDPFQYWSATSAGKVPVDPDISPQSSDELVIGGEYEIIQNGRLGVSYTKRWMNNVIEDMSRDEANTYFIGNPGKGIASDFPEAKRDYDAVTFYFQKAFADLWLAQASYTVSYLRGNYAGLFRPETLQLDPNINSDFDLISLLPNRDGPLPGDRRHDIKIFGAKAFEIPGGMVLDLGLTFRTRAGGPTNLTGGHAVYGADEVFILPRGSGERLPWVHNVDGHIGYSFDLAKDSQLILSMDVFNLFNFQEVTQIDQRYTSADVLPCVDGTTDDLPNCIRRTDGEAFTAADVNPNFGNPTSYQSPRTFRFGARVTF